MIPLSPHASYSFNPEPGTDRRVGPQALLACSAIQHPPRPNAHASGLRLRCSATRLMVYTLTNHGSDFLVISPD